MKRLLRRARRGVLHPVFQAVVGSLLAATIVAFFVTGLSLVAGIHRGGPAALEVALRAKLRGPAGEPADPRGPAVEILDLGYGRSRVAVESFPGGRLRLFVTPEAGQPVPRVLMLRKGAAGGDLEVKVRCGAGPALSARVAGPTGQVAPRTLIPISCPGAGEPVRIVLRAAAKASPALVLEEIGLFAEASPLLEDRRWLRPDLPDRVFYRRWLPDRLRLLAVLGIALLALSRGRWVAPALAAYGAGLALAVSALALWNLHVPLGAQWASVPLRLAEPAATSGPGGPPIRLAEAARRSRLPPRLWLESAGAVAEPTAGGTELTTAAGRLAYSLELPLTVPDDGLYRFELKSVIHEGDLQIGVLSGDRSTWLGTRSRPAAPRGRPTVRAAEASLAAGESIWVVVTNYRTDRGAPSRATLRALRAEWKAGTSVPGFVVRDLRATLAAGALQDGRGGNLNYGLWMGSNTLRGHGPVYTPGAPPWERMPGYGLVCALAGLLAGSSEPLPIGVSVVLVHLALVTIATGLVARGAVLIMPPATAGLAVGLVAFLPTYISLTFVDAMMPAVAMLIAAGGCLYLARNRDGALGLRHELLLHGGFALWFLLRPDVLPGWAVVSLVLCWRRWRYLLVPAGLLLAIGVSWGAFKYPQTGEFVMTTNSAGAGAMVGLWEVPHRFRWEPSDRAYSDFVTSHGYEVKSRAAARFAQREVYRFWLTYPGYVAVLAFHELCNFVYRQSFPGFLAVEVAPWLDAGFPVALLPFVGYRGLFVWLLLAVVALSLAVGYKRLQTLLLGWPVLFNLPLFFLVYSSAGRFYSTSCVALLVATVPLVLDPGFWRSLGTFRKVRLARSRPGGGGKRPAFVSLPLPRLRAAVVIALFVALAVWSLDIEAYLLAWDELRYTPWLDPAGSKLSVFR